MHDKFEEIITALHKEKGKQWLNDLPQLVEHLSQQWHLSDLKPCENLSFNYVLSGYRNKEPIILKIGLDKKELQREKDALETFNGHGVVKLLDSDFQLNGILMQCAVPGVTLKSLFPANDQQAIAVACNSIDVMHQAATPKQSNFPTLIEWLNILEKEWDIPGEQLQLARQLKNTLLQQTKRNVLLHGDVHYDNILSNADGWLVIDPKGVIGDPIYDYIGPLIREPVSEILQLPDAMSFIHKRIEFIARHLKADVKLIAQWNYVQTVMAICWCIEDNQDSTNMRQYLELTML